MWQSPETAVILWWATGKHCMREITPLTKHKLTYGYTDKSLQFRHSSKKIEEEEKKSLSDFR